MPKHKNPSLGVHEIYNFCRPFLCRHYNVPNLSDPCLSVDKKSRKNIALSLYGVIIVYKTINARFQSIT